MTESEAIKKAIRHFECMKNDAVVVLDSGFGTHPGESDLVYRNRKMYAELAINALEKHIPKKPEMEKYTKRKLYFCPICGTEVTDCTYCSHCGQAIDWSEQLSLYEIEHGRNFKGNKNAR